ncbi:hypothetical protein [Nodularia spumigena]|uniref:hypothetical protein n=1 Tax=Nodularia spumigena TaxID=70799 RepID=UPI0023305534|nr:hypothetical protein [Nodularia spumigena]MDB9318210.1 hypothetical protein [Nodularia spumigena CS-590/01A]MDB9325703.1 hypothetical protein [Nodularia spumigena CS-590/02]MDB9334320.1 hypothetical protein [Nodularia spumigena CS-590/01]
MLKKISLVLGVIVVLAYKPTMDGISPVAQKRAYISLHKNSSLYKGANIVKLLHPDINGGNLQPYALIIKPSVAQLQFNSGKMLRQAEKYNGKICDVTYRGVHYFNYHNPRLLKLENCQEQPQPQPIE